MQPTLVLIVSTSAAPSKEDDDEDHSLLYTYCDLPQAPGARVLKALTLAAKGAVASICGEKVHTLQVEHHGCSFSLSILHIKACLIVIAFPVPVASEQGNAAVTTLASTLLLLAGPSHHWTHIVTPAVIQEPRAELKPDVKALCDVMCAGLLRQLHLDPGTPQLLAPWLAFPDHRAHLQLPPHLQRQLHNTLVAHQSAAVGPVDSTTRSHGPASPRDSEQATRLQLYQRTCCLMYRGMIVVSGMSPEQESIVWNACLCLGLLAEPPASVAQECFSVWSLPVQPAVPHAELHAADSVSGQRGGQAHTQGGSRDRLQHQTLVLVAWQGLVGAVVIQPLEPTLDMCQLGESESIAAAAWLKRVHAEHGPDLISAVTHNTLLHTYSPSALTEVGCAWRAAAFPGLPHTTLHTHMDIHPHDDPHGVMGGGGRGTGSSQATPTKRALQQTQGEENEDSSPGQRSHSRGALARLLLQRKSHAARSRSPRGPPSPTRRSQDSLPLAPRSPRRSPTSPIGAVQARSVAARAHATGRGRQQAVSTPNPFAVHYNQLKVDIPGQFTQGVGRGVVGQQGSPGSPTGGQGGLVAGRGGGGAVAVVLDLLTQRFSVMPSNAGSLALKSTDFIAAAWPVLARCHRQLRQAASHPVAAPPKHSRLCLTLEQVERLAALRAPPDAGLRLGHADSAPWQLHPELAPLSGVNEIVMEVPYTGPVDARVSDSGQPWYVTGQLDEACACEVYVLHSASAYETGVLQQAKLYLEQQRAEYAGGA